ncbi:MAG: ankyrin repeat domain-containing protein [Acidobacteriota bacterium]
MRRLRWVLAVALLAVVPGLAAASTDTVVAAARVGDEARVRELLRSGADVAEPEGDGMTALHWAAHNGDATVARMLVVAGADLEAGTRVGRYRPLHVATRSGSSDVVAVLIEAGADVDAGTTAGGGRALHFAAESGDLESLRHLLAAGAEINAGDEAWMQSPLLYAAARGRTAAVQLLLEGGADIESASRVVWVPEKATAERQARRKRAQRRRALAALETPEEDDASGDAAKTEPEKPADAPREPSSKDDLTESPDPRDEPAPEPASEKAAETESEVSSLEDWQLSEPSKAQKVGFAPGYHDLVGGHGGLTALHLAAREGHVETVLALLDRGARIDRPSGGDQTTALMFGVINGHFDLAMELLGRGADPNALTAAGASPLHAVLNTQWAPKASYPQPGAYRQQETDYLELMEALLKAGARPNVRLSKHLWYVSYNFEQLEDMTGATPFWRAAYATDVEAMRLLHRYGADPTIPTSKLPPRRRVDPSLKSGLAAKNDLSGVPPVETGGPHLSPLHAAAGAGYGERFSGHAHRHVPDGWMPAVRYLVEELGLDVRARDHKAFTPLHNAAARGDDEMVLYLIFRGADVHAKTRKGQTTADMANGPVQRVRPYESTLALLESLGVVNNGNCLSC